MTDADRYRAYGPLHPAAPDCWHDRPSLWRANWPGIVGTAALSGAALFAFGLLLWSFS